MTRSSSSPRAVSMITGTGRALAQPPTHLEAVDARQHEVEHHEIGPARLRVLERDEPVADRVDDDALALEVAHDDLAHGRVVFDDQHPGRDYRRVRCARRFGHHGDRTAISIEHRARRLQPEPEAQPPACRDSRRTPTVASSTHGTNGSQMRSTSAFDMPLRSASATARSAPPTSSQTRRSRSRAIATAAAGPTASANAARSATTKYLYGR